MKLCLLELPEVTDLSLLSPLLADTRQGAALGLVPSCQSVTGHGVGVDDERFIVLPFMGRQCLCSELGLKGVVGPTGSQEAQPCSSAPCTFCPWMWALWKEESSFSAHLTLVLCEMRKWWKMVVR